MILISNDFCHKIKMYNFDSYNVLLAIATNIKYTCAAYDCFCAPGTSMFSFFDGNIDNTLYFYNVYNNKQK